MERCLKARAAVYPSTDMDRVIIKASDVASILNQNNYKSREEVFNELWKKYSPANFTSKTKKELAEEAIAKSETAQAIFSLASSFVSKGSDDAKTTFTKVESIINSDEKLNVEDKKKVLEHVRSKVFTNHGTQKEAETAEKTSMKLEMDDRFHQLYIGTYNERDYVVVGRIDRVEILPDGSKILIEIKNRVNGFFNRVFPRENIQIQVYLEMLGFDKAKLVEQFNNNVNVLEVDRDRKLFEEQIYPGLAAFCFELSSAML